MDALDHFAATAEQYTIWATTGTDEGGVAARNALLHLTRLYACALQLPMAYRGSDEPLDARHDDDEGVSQAELQRAFAHTSRLPLDFYGEVYDPLPVPPEVPGIGSLADDLADIYCDVETGLRHFRAGRRERAHWVWTFNLQTHWGAHATGAIRALHCWLASNDPIHLTAEA